MGKADPVEGDTLEGLRPDLSSEEALAHLEAAEALYAGEFLEEDAYEDWASSLREEAIASYASVLRALGEAALERGDHDAVVRYQLRIIESDAWDERAHLDLVACLQAEGRHGEARRRYERVIARIASIVSRAPLWRSCTRAL